MLALRQAYASVLLDAGESIKPLSECLGHSDPGFTLRTYTAPSAVQRDPCGSQRKGQRPGAGGGSAKARPPSTRIPINQPPERVPPLSIHEWRAPGRVPRLAGTEAVPRSAGDGVVASPVKGGQGRKGRGGPRCR